MTVQQATSRYFIDVEKRMQMADCATLPATSYKLIHRAFIVFNSQSNGAFEICGEPMKNEEIAAFIGVSKTEFDAGFDILIKRNILEKDASGIICYGPFRKWQHRSNVNRANGLKGGRGRKSVRRAQHDLLPTSGTVNQTPKRKSKNSARQASLGLTLASKVRVAATTEEITEIAIEAALLAGLDVSTCKAVAAVKQWLQNGVDRSTILRVIEHKPRPEKGINSLFWYTKAIQAAAS